VKRKLSVLSLIFNIPKHKDHVNTNITAGLFTSCLKDNSWNRNCDIVKPVVSVRLEAFRTRCYSWYQQRCQLAAKKVARSQLAGILWHGTIIILCASSLIPTTTGFFSLGSDTNSVPHLIPWRIGRYSFIRWTLRRRYLRYDRSVVNILSVRYAS
jgi:hypothetical protein